MGCWKSIRTGLQPDNFHRSTFVQNCWRKRTFLESALIKILVVAFLWFVVLCGVYIYGAVMSESGKCAALCCSVRPESDIQDVVFNAFANFSKTKAISVKELAYHFNQTLLRSVDEPSDDLRAANNTDYRKKRESEDPIKFPYIGVLLENLYSDSDNDEKIIKCAITVVGKYWAIASRQCVRDLTQMSVLKVRFGSNYWSKGDPRCVRAVKKILLDENSAFGLINFESGVSDPDLSPTAKFAEDFLNKRRSNLTKLSIYTFNWFSNFYKHRKLEKVLVNLLDSASCRAIISHNLNPENDVFCGITDTDLTEGLMFPLMAADGDFLIAVHWETVFDSQKNRTVFVYLNVSPFGAKLQMSNEE